MGTYDTIGGTPRHDPMFDYDPPCDICGKDPFDCGCYPDEEPLDYLNLPKKEEVKK